MFVISKIFGPGPDRVRALRLGDLYIRVWFGYIYATNQYFRCANALWWAANGSYNFTASFTRQMNYFSDTVRSFSKLTDSLISYSRAVSVVVWSAVRSCWTAQKQMRKIPKCLNFRYSNSLLLSANTILISSWFYLLTAVSSTVCLKPAHCL